MEQSLQDRLKKAELLIKEFKALRILQKEYFKTRDLQVLNQCKLQEKFVAEMMGFPPDWTVLPFQNGESKV